MKIVLLESQYKRLVENRGGHNKSETESFIKKCEEKNPGKFDYSLVDYTGSSDKVKLLCKNLEHQKKQQELTGVPYFERIASKVSAGQANCPICSKRKEHKYLPEELLKIAEKYRDKPISDMKDSKEDLKYYHAIHGYKNDEPEFYKKVMSIFKKASEYRGESFFLNLFIKNGLIPEECETKNCENYQKQFSDCTNRKDGSGCRALKFDFYIPKYNVLVEYDGGQHFRSTQHHGGESKYEDRIRNDFYKYEYIMNNKYRLIRIRERENSLIDESVLGEIVLKAIKEMKDKVILIQNYIKSSGKNGWINLVPMEETLNFVEI